jgi:hypothetical protein
MFPSHTDNDAAYRLELIRLIFKNNYYKPSEQEINNSRSDKIGFQSSDNIGFQITGDFCATRY